MEGPLAETLTATPASAPQPNLLMRIVGMYFSPQETFRAVAARPRWLGVMAITLAISAASYYVIFSSPDLQDAVIDQQIRAMDSRGGASDQQVAAVERFVGLMPQIYTGAVLVFGPLVAAAIAGIVVGIFTTLMGGQGTFKQVYAVIAHAGVISMLAGVLSAALMASGVPPTGVRPPGANLGIFVPMFEETSFIAVFFRSIDLILVWWLVVLAIGIGVVYKRRTGGIAMSLLGIYLVIALLIGTFASGS
jgi:hypothetical protein